MLFHMVSWEWARVSVIFHGMSLGQAIQNFVFDVISLQVGFPQPSGCYYWKPTMLNMALYMMSSGVESEPSWHPK